MKKNFLILMSAILIGTVLLISCKDSLDVNPSNASGLKHSNDRTISIISKGSENNFVGKRDWQPTDNEPPYFPTDGGAGGGGSGIGGGGGGGSVPPSITTIANYNIKVTALPPCMNAPVLDVLAKIGNIDSNLGTVLTKFANNNNTYNYSIRTTTAQNMSNIYRQSSNTPAITGKTADGSFITYLNADILTSSSQEFIASVLIHEIYHIKISQDGHGDYDNHGYYFSNNYVTNIKDDLVQLYGSSSFDSKVALALALGGVTDGGNPSTYNMTLQEVVNTVNSYQANTKGTTKCSN